MAKGALAALLCSPDSRMVRLDELKLSRSRPAELSDVPLTLPVLPYRFTLAKTLELGSGSLGLPGLAP